MSPTYHTNCRPTVNSLVDIHREVNTYKVAHKCGRPHVNAADGLKNLALSIAMDGVWISDYVVIDDDVVLRTLYGQ